MTYSNLIKQLICTALAVVAVYHYSSGQICSAEETKEYRREYYNGFSRWSIGVGGGVSFVRGDLRSFSDDKNYWGGTASIFSGYQLTPTVGLFLKAFFSQNKAGATRDNRGLFLERDGYTYYGINPPSGSKTYGEIYAKIPSWGFGLNMNLNINNFFAGNKGTGCRRWTVLVSPGVYLQRFRPRIYNDNDGSRYTTSDLHYDWNWGLGGEISLRYKASRVVDINVKSGLIWTANNKFDGIRSRVSGKRNFYNNWEMGVIFKLGSGKKHKSEHLLYASTRRYVKLPEKDQPIPVWIKHDTIQIETPPRVVEVEKVVEVEVREFPELPAIYFRRGSMDIDESDNRYGLQFLIATLKEFPEVNFRILGFADHTGGQNVNETISYGRAEALKYLLLENGIDDSRIKDVVGMGKDPDKTGPEALSVEARRAVIKKID